MNKKTGQAVCYWTASGVATAAKSFGSGEKAA